MPQIVFIRPGCTDFDQQHRIQGSIELPMNEEGQQQVRQLLDQLRDLPLEVIYTSPAQPARCTAEAVAGELGIPVKLCDELRSLNQGLWEGLQLEEIRFKYPKVFRQWQESPETICPPQGETVEAAIGRVRKALRKPMKRKACFGVVLSEPLATLVQCDLSGRKLEAPEPAAAGGRVTRIDVHEPGDTLSCEEMDSIDLGAHPRFNGETVAAARPADRGDHSR